MARAEICLVLYTYANMSEVLNVFCLLPVGNFTDAFKIALEEVALTTSSSEKHTNALCYNKAHAGATETNGICLRPGSHPNSNVCEKCNSLITHQKHISNLEIAPKKNITIKHPKS